MLLLAVAASALLLIAAGTAVADPGTGLNDDSATSGADDSPFNESVGIDDYEANDSIATDDPRLNRGVSTNALFYQAEVTPDSIGADEPATLTADVQTYILFFGWVSLPDDWVDTVEWESDAIDGTESGNPATLDFESGGEHDVDVAVDLTYGLSFEDSTTVHVEEPAEPIDVSIEGDEEVDVSEPVTVEASVSPDDRAIESFDWSDDGLQDADGATATYDFEKGGNQSVSVTATPETGEPATDNSTIEVENEDPVAKIDLRNIGGIDLEEDKNEQIVYHTLETAEGIEVNGTSSYDPDGHDLEYHWDFSDPDLDDQDGPTAVVNESEYVGEIDINLTVDDGHGGINSTEETIYVVDFEYDGPHVHIVPPSGAEHFFHTLDSRALKLVSNPHKYIPVAGNYIEQIENELKKLDQQIHEQGTQLEPGDKQITAKKDEPVSFTSVTVSAVPPVEWKHTWNIERTDGTTRTKEIWGHKNREITHSWDEAGTYEVELTARGAAGDTDTDTVKVKVEEEDDDERRNRNDRHSRTDPTSPEGSGGGGPPGPVPPFPAEFPPDIPTDNDWDNIENRTQDRPVAALHSPNTVAVGEEVTIDGSESKGGSSEIKEYEWIVDNGEIDSDVDQATATFSEPGKKMVTLVITNEDDKVDSASKYITVVENTDSETGPTAEVEGPETALLGKPVTFDGSASTAGSGQIEEYSWTFERAMKNPDTDDQHAELAFYQPGTHEVTLAVKNTDGDWDYKTKEVHVIGASLSAPDAAPTNETFNVRTNIHTGDEHVESFAWNNSESSEGNSATYRMQEGGIDVEVDIQTTTGDTHTLNRTVESTTTSLEAPETTSPGTEIEAAVEPGEEAVEVTDWQYKPLSEDGEPGSPISSDGKSAIFDFDDPGKYELAVTIVLDTGESQTVTADDESYTLIETITVENEVGDEQVLNRNDNPHGELNGSYEWNDEGATTTDRDSETSLQIADDGGVDPNFTVDTDDNLTMDFHWRHEDGDDLAYLFNDEDSISNGFRAYTNGDAHDGLRFRNTFGGGDIYVDDTVFEGDTAKDGVTAHGPTANPETEPPEHDSADADADRSSDGAQSRNVSAQSHGGLQDGQWYQIRLVLDADEETYTVYMNDGDGFVQAGQSSYDGSGFTAEPEFRMMGRQSGSSTTVSYDQFLWTDEAIHPEDAETIENATIVEYPLDNYSESQE